MVKPLIFIFGTGIFLLSFVCHILIWRMVKPLKEITWLITIFFILPVLGLIILPFSVYSFNILLIILWHFVLSGAYMMTYPVIQADCPSLKIVLAVARSMPQGLTLASALGLFPEEALLANTFDKLADEGLIFLKNEKCVICRKGRLLSAIFSLYRHLLKLPPGEG